MTPDEVQTLAEFLAGGVIVGVVMGWVDQLVARWKGRP
jgi:F0F1-type ATP synthase assembly protein I